MVGRIPLLMEAAVWLTVVRVASRVLPARSLLALVSNVKEGSRPRTAREEKLIAGAVARAVDSISRRFPGKSQCLNRALAVRGALARRGIRTELRLGVRRPRADATLTAHAWIEYRGGVIAGSLEDLSSYAAFD